MLEKYSANPSSNQGSVRTDRLPSINWCAYSWKTTDQGLSTDISSMMKLRSSPPWNSPASSVGFPLNIGATCRISLQLRKATICRGTDRFTCAFVIRVPNTERICYKWSAKSRPLLSPASVITEKFGERTSTHCGSPAKLWRDHRTRHPSTKHNLRNRMTALPRETARERMVPHNAAERITILGGKPHARISILGSRVTPGRRLTQPQ